MRIIRFIGDVHGKFDLYLKVIDGVKESIQVGDMGVGFRRELKWTEAPTREGHRFIRGNHDNPTRCLDNRQFITDGTLEGEMMFVGGAYSIDWMFRTEGRSWWADEELSATVLAGMVSRYAMAKPKIMITHECPESISDKICDAAQWKKYNLPSRTRQAFQSMFEIHRPKLWIFGHWHLGFDGVINGTRFICLNELEYVDIDVDGVVAER